MRDQKLDAAGRGRDKSEPAHVIDQHQQRVPKAIDVGNQDRLLVPAELRPGHLLDELLERAEAARQGDERIRPIEHGAFAFVHVAGDDLLLREPPRLLFRRQKFRNDAGRGAAVADQ